MLKLMTNLPENILGVTAEGKITGDDYENVLIPALEKKLKEYKKINMLYHLGCNFSDFELNAILDDAKMGLKHLSAWEKIALVSDHEMINAFAKFFGYMFSCELRIFKNAEIENAKKWIIEEEATKYKTLGCLTSDYFL